MSELSRLISRLQRGIARNASYVKTIRHPQLLVASLQELNELIGNEKVKDAVATQVSHLIMVKRRALEDSTIKEDKVMLNTVLYGPPGVGKTLIGTKLAKIWYSLGYLDGSGNTKKKKQELKSINKDMFKDGVDTTSTTSSSIDSTFAFYILFLFIMMFLGFLSMVWGFYNRFGGIWTIVAMVLIIFIIISFAYFMTTLVNENNNNNSLNIKNNNKKKDDKIKDNKRI